MVEADAHVRHRLSMVQRTTGTNAQPVNTLLAKPLFVMRDFIDFLPAAQSNALNNQYQNNWNAMAAQHWAASQDALRATPEPSPFARYSQPQGGGISRFGDELYIDGQPHGSLRTAAMDDAPGQDPDTYFSRLAASRAAASAAQRRSYLTGESFAGNEEAFLADPQVQRMNPAQVNETFQGVYGRPIADYNITRRYQQMFNQPDFNYSDLSRMGAEQKAAMQQLKLMEDQYGMPVAQMHGGGYDPASEMLTIPAKTRTDDLGAVTTLSPERKFRLPRAAYEQALRSLQTMFPGGGFSSPEEELAQLESAKAAFDQQQMDTARRQAARAPLIDDIERRAQFQKNKWENSTPNPWTQTWTERMMQIPTFMAR